MTAAQAFIACWSCAFFCVSIFLASEVNTTSRGSWSSIKETDCNFLSVLLLCLIDLNFRDGKCTIILNFDWIACKWRATSDLIPSRFIKLCRHGTTCVKTNFDCCRLEFDGITENIWCSYSNNVNCEESCQRSLEESQSSIHCGWKIRSIISISCISRNTTFKACRSKKIRKS